MLTVTIDGTARPVGGWVAEIVAALLAEEDEINRCHAAQVTIDVGPKTGVTINLKKTLARGGNRLTSVVR